MNILSKIFKGYETKDHMRNRLEAQIEILKMENRLSNKIYPIERDVIEVGARIEMNENAPMEYIKRQLCFKITEELMNLIEFDVFDGNVEYFPRKMLYGRIYVAKRK